MNKSNRNKHPKLSFTYDYGLILQSIFTFHKPNYQNIINNLNKSFKGTLIYM